jgi:hypothetical protein
MEALAPSAEPAVRPRRGALLASGARDTRVRGAPAPVWELLACASALTLLALIMSAGHIGDGGFYYDDWSLLALGRFPGHGGVLHGLWLDYGQRPGQVLYYAAIGQAFGVSAPGRLALASATLVLEVSCLYALLRRLGLATLQAAAIAGLVLTFPFSDSVWLWGVLSLSSLAIAVFLLGVMLALRALQRTGRRALVLNGASLTLYLASVASYEVVAVAACLAGLLYVRQAGLLRARRRWAADVAAVALTLLATRALLPIDIATPSRMQSLAGMVSHAGLIGARGVRLLGAAAVPVDGVSPWIGCALIAAVLTAAMSLRHVLSRSDALREDVGRWLAIAGAGVLVAFASWAVYVPASDHYLPGASGTVNRINAGAAIGIAIVLYAALVLLARMIGRLLRLPSSAATIAVAVLTIALLGGYLGRAARDARSWDAAAADQRAELTGLHAALPRIPADASVFAFDAPQLVGPGVPVLDTPLDLTSALRISYRSPQLLGVPLAGKTSLTCGARGPTAGSFGGVYGASYLVDVRLRAAVRLTSRRQCSARRSAPPPASGTLALR